GRKLVVAQQIMDAYNGENNGKQIGTLKGDGGRGQPTVGFALQGQFAGTCPTLADQMLRRSDQVVIGGLLVQKPARVIPGIAELGAAANLSNRIDAAAFQQRDGLFRESRPDGLEETAVRVEQCGRIACRLQAF